MKRPHLPNLKIRQRGRRARVRIGHAFQRAVVKFGLLDAAGLGCMVVAGALWHPIAAWVIGGASFFVMSYRLGGVE